MRTFDQPIVKFYKAQHDRSDRYCTVSFRVDGSDRMHVGEIWGPGRFGETEARFLPADSTIAREASAAAEALIPTLDWN